MIRNALCRLVLLAAALAGPPACHSRDAAPRDTTPKDYDLSVRLAAGEVRAGTIRSPAELIGGPTAKGRVGDIKLYNSKVTFIVGASAAGHGYAPVGGKVIDADRVRAPGELGQSNFGEWALAFDQNVSSAERIVVVEDGSLGRAVVRVSGPAAPVPFFEVVLEGIVPRRTLPVNISVDYILEPDAEHLRVVATIENTTNDPIPIQMRQMGLIMGDGAAPFFEGPGFEVKLATYPYFAAVAETLSYGLRDEAPITFIFDYQAFLIVSQGGFTLPAKDKRSFTTHLAVGGGDTESLRHILARSRGEARMGTRATGRYLGTGDSGIEGAKVHAVHLDPTGPRIHVGVARTDAEGRYEMLLEPGTYELRALSASRPASEAVTLTIPTAVGSAATSIVAPDLRAPGTATLRYRVIDETGRLIPAKLTWRRGRDLVRSSLASMFGEQPYADGAPRFVAAHKGHGDLQVAAGPYGVTVSRGFEYTIAERDLELRAGAIEEVTFTLRKVIDVGSHLSGDFHIHAQASADSNDSDEAKAAMFAAEGLQVAVSTEHEFVTDYAPVIERMGLRPWVRSIVGEEVTTFTMGHFNAFPLAVNPSLPNQGHIPWPFKSGVELFDLIKGNSARPLLQVNHPRGSARSGYFTAVGFDPATGSVADPRNWSTRFDALEVINGKGVPEPTGGILRDWYGLLNAGLRITGTGNSDSHAAYQGDEVAYPRNYVRVPDADLARFDEAAFVAGVKAGHVVVSGCAFLRVAIDGRGPGDSLSSTSGTVELDIEATAAPWCPLSDLAIIANGAIVHQRELTFADVDPQNPERRFKGKIALPVARDTWFVVYVRGGSIHPVVTNARAFALTNPIYVDADGNGRFDALNAP